MKDITKYIYESYAEQFLLNEGIISWFKAFIKKIKDNMMNKINKDGSINTIDADPKNFKIQNEPIQVSKITKDTLKQWNTKVGFPDTVKLIKNIKQYASGNESDPYLYETYYQDPETNEYLEGVVIMYEPKIKYLFNYTHILNIEVSKIYEDLEYSIQSIFDEFSNKIKEKNPKNKGFTIIDQLDFKELNKWIKKLKFIEVQDSELKNKPENIYMLKK